MKVRSENEVFNVQGPSKLLYEAFIQTYQGNIRREMTNRFPILTIIPKHWYWKVQANDRGDSHLITLSHGTLIWVQFCKNGIIVLFD